MSLKKTSLLLLTVLFVVACDQVGLGIGNGVKNFFLSPVKEVSKIFTNKEYKRQKDLTLKKSGPKQDKEMSYCLGRDGKPISLQNMSQIRELGEAVRNLSCQCRAWGSCPQAICPCEQLCPEGFEIFKRFSASTSELSGEENGLAFRNGDIPSKHRETMGYCWGHAKVTSQLNRMAFFKPELKPPFDLTATDEEEQNKAIKYYKDLIDQVNKNQATDIPGFKNLKEFSEHPAFQSYLADRVAKTWAKEAMSWQGLQAITNAKKKSNRKYQKVIDEIKERLDLNMQPTIVFNPKGIGMFSHAVLVSHYETAKNGTMKLCIRDNNYPESHASKCEDYMWLHPKDGLIYERNGFTEEVGHITVAHNENADVLSQSSSLREKCKAEKGCGD